jgi:hypothetical protein
VKLADISGKRKKEYLKAKIDELENNSKIKNIRDLYRGIIDFMDGYQPGTSIVKVEKGNFVTYSHSFFWLGGGTISLSCSVYMGLVILDRQKYILQNH